VTTRRATWVLFLAGLLLQLLFVVRARDAWPSYPEMPGNIVARDSLQFRGLMTSFLEAPGFVPTWKKSGTGTDIPGCLLPILLAGPPMATGDVRSSVLVVVLFHLLAGLLLLRTVREAFGDRFALAFTAVFWLSPWRLFHSGFTWEPNLMILPAAIHVRACWVSRETPRRGASLLLGATLVLSLQIHLSAIFLILLTVLLLWRRTLKVSWPAFLAGGAAAFLPLLPAALAWLRGSPLVLSSDTGFPGRGFLLVLPVLRAVQFWLRLGSLDVGRMYAGDCVSCARAAIGGGPVDAAWCLVYRLGGWLASASVVVPAAAAWWSIRRGREADRPAPERWLSAYAWTALVALMLAAGLSPITLQTWHVFVAAPAASLPVAAWLVARWPFEKRWIRILVAVFFLLRLPIAGLLAFDYGAFCLVPPAVARAMQD